jgi:hypothetical protein
VAAYEPSDWSDLFVASAGASAALAGLVFVAVSINIEFIAGVASVLAESGGGLSWTAAGIIFGIAGAVANAWVLLVEILR